MKTILLDTQVFLWMQNDPDRLSEKIKSSLKSTDYRWFLSQISVWEIQVKYDTGKLSLPTKPSECIPEIIRQSGLAYQNLQDDAIFMLGRLPQLHRDPFDRLLVATCIVNGWTLATVDEQIKEYPVQTVS